MEIFYVLTAELWDILSTLKISWVYEHMFILIDCDSKVVVELINKGCPPSHPYSSLAHHFQMMVAKTSFIKLKHVFRESNMVVDSFAVLAHSRPVGLFILQALHPLEHL